MKLKLILIVVVALIGCESQIANEDLKLSQQELIARGEYLTQILDCATCHSPKVITQYGPVPDTSLLMSGHPENIVLPVYDKNLILKDGWALMSGTVTALVGPWGESYAGNLTPDDTGIGTWSSEQFRAVLKHGKYKGLEGSRPLLPPMPVSAFKHLTDEDTEAIFQYLRTLKPVKNIVPAFQPLDNN